MSFGLYLTGFIVLIVGLAIGANMLHIPPRWIGVGIVVMVGLGILSGVTMTRSRDSSD
jgi:amino acid permease